MVHAPQSLILGVARETGNAQSESRRVLSAEMKQTIFNRDDHTCACCGFRSEKFQEILHRNGVTTDWSPTNLATACLFCHQVGNLQQVGAMRSGVLVWLPEITQPELSHLARAIYVARLAQGPVADAARQALDALMARRDDAKDRLGTDDPHVLASVLRDMISPNTYDRREEKLDGIRLFPLDRRMQKEGELEFNQFPQILAYWRSKDGPFGGQLPLDWLGLYRRFTTQEAA